MSRVIHLSESEFQDTVSSSQGIVIVDFWAPWCGPCRMLGNTLDQISEDNPDITIYKINVDECQFLPEEYNIQSIPAMLFFRNGQMINQTTGNLTASDILQNCQ